MTKSEKLMFAGAPRSIRRSLTQMRKDQVTAKPFMMTNTVSRPDFVVLCDGRTVKYTGP